MAPAKRGQKRKLKEEKENQKMKKEDIEDDFDEDIPDYERQRMKNIAERQNKFDELRLNDLVHDVSAEYAVKNSRTAASRRGLSAPQHQSKISNNEPVRKSLRLQKIDADTGLSLPEKEPTHYFITENENPRPALTDLTLEDLCNNNDDCPILSQYFNTFSKFMNESKKFSKDFTTLEKRLKSLKINTKQVAKVVPDRIFGLAVHPTESKLIVAAGGKWGSIGFWDVQDDTSATHGVQVIKVTKLKTQ